MAAMANHPEVQARAQGELASAIGSGRLPTMEDRAALPYVNAVVKECLRWRSVVPIPPPHVSTQEDEYKGYRIPKGTVVVSNVWYVSPNVKRTTATQDRICSTTCMAQAVLSRS